MKSLSSAALLFCALSLGSLAPAQEIPTYAPLPPAPADASTLPRIVLVSMGGTIASRGAPRSNVTNYGGGVLPRVEPIDWVNAMPELNGVARITVDDQRAPLNRASGTETHEDFHRVSKRLNELAADPTVDGMVVTHGTNTLSEVAYYMTLTVKTNKPIVYVGSQRPWSAMSGDGPRNLYDAFRVAASKDAWGKGVLHSTNNLITPARDVDKTSAYRTHTFKGVDVGAIGFADPDRIVFQRDVVRRHTVNSEFAGQDYPTVPAVEIFYGYREAPGYFIDAAVEHGVKGLIIDGVGAGGATLSQQAAIKRAQEKGVVVVMTARTYGGRVQDTPRRREAKMVPGDNLHPEKARVLLQLALTKTTDLAEIQRIFSEY